MESVKITVALIGVLVLMGMGLPRTGREERDNNHFARIRFAQVGRQADPRDQRREETRKADAGAQRGDNQRRPGSQSPSETLGRENEALRRIQEPTLFERQTESALERQDRQFYESQKPTQPQQQKSEQQKRAVVLGGCQEGYVWREAIPGDHVCVTPGARAQVLRDNNQALDRRDPKGANGPNTCIEGYVWREGAPGDYVCVRPEVRAQAQRENTDSVNRAARELR